MSDVSSTAADLRMSVYRLTRRMRQEYPAGGPSLTQLSALAIVWREGPLTAGELAARERVRPPSITRVIDVLESAGLVTREPNPDDGRQVLVRVTPSGEQRVQQSIGASQAWLARQLEQLADADRELLERAARLLADLAER